MFFALSMLALICWSSRSSLISFLSEEFATDRTFPVFIRLISSFFEIMEVLICSSVLLRMEPIMITGFLSFSWMNLLYQDESVSCSARSFETIRASVSFQYPLRSCWESKSTLSTVDHTQPVRTEATLKLNASTKYFFI